MTPIKGTNPRIVLIGKRNAGKSALLNALTKQELSIVSDTPGTTTDPVEKAYELQPYGPVVWIDTAGLDDEGSLGQQRIEKTKSRLSQADLVLYISESSSLDSCSLIWLSELKKENRTILLVLSKEDSLSSEARVQEIKDLAAQLKLPVLSCSATTNSGIEKLKDQIIIELQKKEPDPPMLADLVQAPAIVVLVIPIDKEAPAGRLILPQVQAIRELLDYDIPCVVVKERELSYTLSEILKVKPNLVVTDSQAFLKVHGDIPPEVPLTSFSILLARQKGDLITYVKGLNAINSLKNGNKILIMELCSHRPLSEDIGRVKIPRWLMQYTGLELTFEVASGKDIPEDLSPYSLIIQCGGCTANRAFIQSAIRHAVSANVPITNYGLSIAYLQGIIERVLTPFPAAKLALNSTPS